MVEYGVLVNNKFDFAGDQSEDEAEDPSVLLQKADVTKVEKTAAQKKAEKKAEKLKKEKAAAAAKEAEAKKAAIAAKAAVVGKENARPEGGRGGPRGGRGAPRGAGGERRPRENGDGERPPFTGERGRGRGGPRGGRGGGFRGGRGGNVSGGEEHPHDEQPKDAETQPAGDRPPFAGRGRGGRGRGGPPRSDGEQRSPREFDATAPAEDRPPRGPRGGRGFRGRFGDRQSGSDRTGVKSVDSKSGHGKGNWGSEQDDIVDADKTENAEKTEEEVVIPAAPREKTAEEIAAEEEEARIASQKTLAEFRAEQKKKDASFNLRKAGEGEDANFGKLVPIPKKNLQDENAGDEEEVVIVKKEPRNKQIIVDFKFNDPNRGGDFGGRGRGGDRGRRGGGTPGGRGRGGRGGGGGGQGRYNEPFHVAEESFPALGAA